MKIGFIGLGIMGSRMAANLIAANYSLVVWNRSRDKALPLEAQGATVAESPAALAQEVDILFTVLAHPKAVEAAALGEDGFLSSLKEGALWIDSTTSNPAFARQMAAEASARNIRFLDAPVGGSKTPAAEGQLIFVVGGAEDDVEDVRALLEIMGSRIVHVGPHGMGISLKLVLNNLLGNTMAAFSEAVHFGKAMGIPQGQLLNILLGGPLVAPYLSGKRDKFESGDYDDTEFPLQWMQKDMAMVSQTAFEVGVPMPVSNLSKELFAMAMHQGLGEKDFSALFSLNDPDNKAD